MSTPEVLAPVSAVHVRSALTDARQGFDRFKKDNRDWLRDNLALLLSATELTYETAIENNGINDADAALQGAYLGGAVLRLSIQDGTYSTDFCNANLAKERIGERGFAFKPDDLITEHDLVRFHGEEAAREMMDIKSPIARTLCSMVIGTALIPNQITNNSVSS